MKKALCLFITIIVLIYGCAKDNSIIPDEGIKIFSNILNEEREISIYLPDTYGENTDNYPVLYVLDGETHYMHAQAATQYLSDNGYIPQMIVVSIINVDRNRDFSPVHVDNIPTSGGAEAFLNFLSDELMPYIEKQYRTSGFDMLVGHSFGGVFATYTLFEKPDLFDAFISISPYLQFADNYLVKESYKKLKPFDHPVTFYMSLGVEPAYYDALDKFSTIIYYGDYINLDFNYKMFDTEDHMSNPYPSLYYGLRYIFRDWQIPADIINEGLEAIDTYYRDLSKKYGINAVPPENILNNLGYAYLQNEDTDYAITIFEANVAYHPNSPNVYDSLGEALETTGQLKEAKKNYKKAWDLGEKQNHPLKAIFKENFERLN